MRIGKLNGRFVVAWNDEDGTRRRYRLKATDRKAAEAEGRDVLRRQTARPSGHLVADLFAMYREEKKAKPIATTVGYTAKALLPHFGSMRPDQITVQDCREYDAIRREQGRSVGTVWTELGHLRIVCRWAEKSGLIDRVPHIEIPTKPMPKERYLTDPEIRRLLEADAEPHIRLAILLMLTTAARVGAILDLTWDRVDLQRGQINLRLDQEGPRKGRAVVPINDTLMAALSHAATGAVSDYVIEWAGKPVKSIRRGFNKAVENAGLADVTPHVCRHTAAVRMAAAGHPMQKIAQFLGHSSTNQTEKVYARYAPDHLMDAASALEIRNLRIVR